MVILTVRDIRKHFGPDPVLEKVTFDLRAGERLSLVGPNGTGKTTLLRILMRQEEPDSGEVVWSPSVRVGYLEQHPTFAEGRTVWQEAQAAFADASALASEAEQVALQMAEAETDELRERLGQRFDFLQHELSRLDVYEVDHRIERVLHGLGFGESSFTQPVNQLSGGQQNRLVLARLLLEQPDMMLLDEPSNHLDIEATQWLENYLIESAQSLIVVSHDRYFLDKVTTRTLELFRGEVDSFPGNYTAYKRQKAERLEVERRTYEKQQIEIAKMEDFVRRNHYGQKHAQAEDRRKKLERIERVPPPREISAPVMGFPAASRSGDIVLRVEHLTKGFRGDNESPLFRDLNFDVLRGEKWGILGANGIGKTTLLRCMLDLLEPDEGRVNVGTGAKIGYFDQLLSCLPAETTVVEAIRPDHKEFVEQQRRDLLARFGITGDLAFQDVRSLSGGERNRAALAMLAASDANVLVLDEPTNHLDLWARDALERSLTAFDGTVVFVSHDRYFLNQVADHLLVMEPQKTWIVDGDYDTFRRIKTGAGQSAPADAKSRTDQAAKQRQQSKREPSRWRFPFRKVADLEREIAGCEASIAEIHQQMLQPDVVRDGAAIKQLLSQLSTEEDRLRLLYEHWEESLQRNT